MTDEITFDSLSLHENTLKALREHNYVYPTRIQQMGIKNALEGLDISGSAKTGSGKTLAFLLPALEILSKNDWKKEDGLGCLIITPTRELAYQIFEVLKKVGKYYDFSTGLIFGGKNIKDEAKYIQKMNILIATPGRLLQHMDQTRIFECFRLKLLVIDEADKIMEPDFAQSLRAILENLPEERQTLIYSATMNSAVGDLVRMVLNKPVFLNAHEESRFATPKKLNQFYTTCELHEKINFLYTFIKTHLHSKIIVFMSCCKQVRYIYRSFCFLTPGTVLLSLHGSQKQAKRIEAFDKFNKKKACVLLSTDLAARGLDFPVVDWVVQLDCPADGETYIHRVGRTARFNKSGSSLLILLPSEINFIDKIQKQKIPIQPIYFKNTKITDISRKLASYCAQDVENKVFAQQCFVSYLKSLYFLNKKKESYIKKLSLEEYSKSLGLRNPPELKFIKNRKESISESNDNCEDFLTAVDVPTKIPAYKASTASGFNFNKVKVVSKASLAKKLAKTGQKINKKIKFSNDDE